MATPRQQQTSPCETARRNLRAAGISIPEWAEANGFSTATVKAVIYGHSKGLRGEAHRVAIALGIKTGVVVNAKGFRPVRRAHVPLAAIPGARS